MERICAHGGHRFVGLLLLFFLMPSLLSGCSKKEDALDFELAVGGVVTRTVTAGELAGLPTTGGEETQGFSLMELMLLLGVGHYSNVTVTNSAGESSQIYGYGLFSLRDGGAALDYAGGLGADPSVSGITAMNIESNPSQVTYVTAGERRLSVAAELAGFKPLTLEADGYTRIDPIAVWPGSNTTVLQTWQGGDGIVVYLSQYQSSTAPSFEGEPVDLNGKTAYLSVYTADVPGTDPLSLSWSAGDIHCTLSAAGLDAEALLAFAGLIHETPIETGRHTAGPTVPYPN